MDYIPEKFWEERYQRLDLTRSGHRDLPEAYNRWLYRRKQAVLRAGLRSVGFAVTGQRVLEVGVGLGAYLPLWQSLGAAQISGIDLSAAAVQYLRERFPALRVAQRDAALPGLRDECGEFELITALDVLYHVVDDDKLGAVLRNVAQTLAPGGVLAFHDQFLHRATEDRGYIRWRSLADWERLLAEAGLRILARRPIFFTMIQTNDCATAARAARMDALWRRMVPWINRAPGLCGALAYAVDSVLGRVLSEGPSMELMLVCRASEGKPA